MLTRNVLQLRNIWSIYKVKGCFLIFHTVPGEMYVYTYSLHILFPLALNYRVTN